MSKYIKPLPKRASNRAISQAYRWLALETKGRINSEKEQGSQLIALLHDYCAACANLYGEIDAQSVWEILTTLEPELIRKKKLLKKDFASFTEILRLEQPDGYYVFEISELYLDEHDNKPFDRSFVQRELVGRSATITRLLYFCQLVTAREKNDTTICIPPTKEELLSWANPQRMYEYQQVKELKRIFEKLCVAKDSKLTDINGVPVRGKLLSEIIVWDHNEKDDYEYYKKVAWRRKEMEEQFNVVQSDKLLKRAVYYTQSPFNDNDSYVFQRLRKDLENTDVKLSGKQTRNISKLCCALNENCRKQVLCGWTQREWNQYTIKNAPFTSTVSSSKEELTDLMRKGKLTRQHIEMMLQLFCGAPSKDPQTEEERQQHIQQDFERTAKILNVRPPAGRIKALPQPASDKEINSAYLELALKTQGRLDRTKTGGKKLIDLLHTEFAAFANLYGFFTPLHAWDFIRIVESGLIRAGLLCADDIFAFCDLLRLEQPVGYFVLEMREIFPNLSEKFGKEFRHIISYDLVVPQNKQNIFLPFDVLFRLQTLWLLGYDVPSKAELLNWADPYYIYTTPQADKIKNFFEHLRVPMSSQKKDTDGFPIKGRTLESFTFLHNKSIELAKKFNTEAYNDETESEKLSNMLIHYIHDNSITSSATLLTMLNTITDNLRELDITLSFSQQDMLANLVRDATMECRTRPTHGYRLNDLNNIDELNLRLRNAYSGEKENTEIKEKIKNSGLRFV